MCTAVVRCWLGVFVDALQTGYFTLTRISSCLYRHLVDLTVCYDLKIESSDQQSARISVRTEI